MRVIRSTSDSRVQGLGIPGHAPARLRVRARIHSLLNCIQTAVRDVCTYVLFRAQFGLEFELTVDDGSACAVLADPCSVCSLISPALPCVHASSCCVYLPCSAFFTAPLLCRVHPVTCACVHPPSCVYSQHSVAPAQRLPPLLLTG